MRIVEFRDCLESGLAFPRSVRLAKPCKCQTHYFPSYKTGVILPYKIVVKKSLGT